MMTEKKRVTTQFPIEAHEHVYLLLKTWNKKECLFSVKITVLQKPRHLFIGRCSPKDKLYHQENIILNNQNKMHILANIRVN